MLPGVSDPASPSASPSASAVMRIARSAGGALLVQAGLHAQLLRVEWAEMRGRLLKMLLATLLGFACLLGLMVTLTALLLAASWHTPYRIPAVIALIALYGSGLALAWRHFKLQSALNAASFAATRAELAEDLALLRSHL